MDELYNVPCTTGRRRRFLWRWPLARQPGADLRELVLLAALVILLVVVLLAVATRLVTQPRVQLVGLGLSGAMGPLAQTYRALPPAQRDSFIADVTRSSGGHLVRDDPARWTQAEPTELVHRLLVETMRTALPEDFVGFSPGPDPQLWVGLSDAGRPPLWLRMSVAVAPASQVPAILIGLLAGAIVIIPLGGFYLRGRHRYRLRRASEALSTIDPAQAQPSLLAPTAKSGPLGAQLADLARRLDHLQSDCDKVVAGAALRLRTCAARLDSQWPEALLAGPPGSREAIDRLIDQLDAFSRASPQWGDGACDGSTVVAQVVGEMDARWPMQPGRLTLEGAPLPELPLPAPALRSALEQVLDNAQRHGEGPVLVRTGRMDDVALIQVLHAGDAPAQDELALMGHPFFRGERARARGLGAGLGLALAIRALRPYGASLHWHAREGGGLEAEIRLPLHPVGAAA